MKLISARLSGFRCAWSDDDRYRNKHTVDYTKLETLIPVCPEQMGRLQIHRVSQEIQGRNQSFS